MFKCFASKSKWEDEKLRIWNLRDELLELGNCPQSDNEIYEYTVKFLNITSKFQDEGKIKYSRFAEAQKCFNLTINTVGRSFYSHSRNCTKKGQEVTLDNLYCGNIYGLQRYTARVWMHMKIPYASLANKWAKNPLMDNMSQLLASTVIARYQLKPWISTARNDLLELSSELLNVK